MLKLTATTATDVTWITAEVSARRNDAVSHFSVPSVVSDRFDDLARNYVVSVGIRVRRARRKLGRTCQRNIDEVTRPIVVKAVGIEHTYANKLLNEKFACLVE